MMLRALLVVPACVLAFATFAAHAEKPLAPPTVAGAMLVSAEQVVELITAPLPPVLLDSRRREEFDKGHLEGAVHMHDTELTREKLARLAAAPERALLFYCNGERCLRSSNSARQAVAWGYRKVYWFRGGWQEWTDKHLPVAH